MPPKRARPSVKKSPPHVNVSDVLDQPLAALGAAINALRSRPHPLAPSEAAGIAREAPQLLRRAKEAIEVGRGHAVVPAAVALLLDGTTFSNEIEAKIVSNVGQNKKAMDALDACFAFAVEGKAVDVAAQIDVVELLQYFTEAAETKEECGERFMVRLARVFEEPQVHFALHRVLCTNLIGLVKCSKDNKLRLPSYSPVVKALLTTTDYFLQLQCTEVLYRVSRQHPLLLEKVKDELPAMLFDGIRSLPNNGDLFTRMSSLVADWNRTREPRLILDFGVSNVDAGGKKLTGATTVFFSPKILIVIIENTSADNVSIEYTTIRSLRFRPGAGLVIRLREPPAAIADRLTIGEDGKDSITLNFVPAAVEDFKRSNIQKWISSVLRDSAAAAVTVSDASKRSAATNMIEHQTAVNAGPQADGPSPPERLSHNRRVATATSRLLLVQSSQQEYLHGDAANPDAEQTPVSATADAVAAKLRVVTPPEYYPAPPGLNIARPLDMDTPIHAVAPNALPRRRERESDLLAAPPLPPSTSASAAAAMPPMKKHCTELHASSPLAARQPTASRSMPSVAASGAGSRASLHPLPRHDYDDEDAGTPGVDVRAVSMDLTATERRSAAKHAPSPVRIMDPLSPEAVAGARAAQQQQSTRPKSRSARQAGPQADAPTDVAGDLSGLSRRLLQDEPEDDVPGWAAPTGATTAPMSQMLGDLQRAVELRMAEQRAEADAVVTRCLDDVQKRVNDGRAAIASDVSSFKGFVDAHVDKIRQRHHAVDDAIDAGVRDLNTEVQRVRDVRRSASEMYATLETEFRQVTSKLRGREDEELRQIKRHVEGELGRLQREANDAIREQPMQFLAAGFQSALRASAANASASRAPSNARLGLVFD
jgi:hypothetical protein